MSLQALSSRAVMGMYYQALETQAAAGWIDAISNYFTSDQASETYPWIDAVPGMREWIGGRKSQGLGTNEVTIINKHFEATLPILLKDLRRDKTGQLEVRINEFAAKSFTHFASMLSTLVVGGATGLCYDGQYFFDTDHSEGDSGTQSNKISTDISALPATAHGVVAVPSPEEMQQAILKSVSQFYTFVDDKGEPINETASEFLVMVPVGLQSATQSALTTVREAAATTFDMENLKIRAAVNPRLTAAGWVDQFATFRTDGFVKSLIRQEETEPVTKMKGEDSDFCFDNDAIEIGVDSWRNVGYGRWQGAVHNTLV